VKPPRISSDGVPRVRLWVEVYLTRSDAETALTDAVQGAVPPPATVAGIVALLREYLAGAARTGAEYGGNVYNATDRHREWAGDAIERLWPAVWKTVREFDDDVPRIVVRVRIDLTRTEVETALTDAMQTTDAPPATPAEAERLLRAYLASIARLGAEFGGNVYNATDRDRDHAEAAAALLWPAEVAEAVGP